MRRIVGTFARWWWRSLQSESAGAALLLVAALAALVWANTHPESYTFVFVQQWPAGTRLSALTLRGVVNDGLMALFFFVVGMEIKRELAVGELRSVSRASLPVIAAIGGMVVPAAVFLGFNYGTPQAIGWGVPMATDIAFCVGVLSLLRDRIPRALTVFVTALAVFDDIGGILVIALFYGSGIDLTYLTLAGSVFLIALMVGRARVESALTYAALGVALWWAVHGAGVHATIAGVALGLTIPTRSRTTHDRPPPDGPAGGGTHADTVAPLERFLHALHRPVAFIVLPLFALANSGVSLADVGLASGATPVAIGVAAALVVGKPVGILVPTLLAVRAGVAPMPGGASIRQLVGASLCAGIGFTVSLFIAALAYVDASASLDQAKLGVLAGSAIAGVSGYCVLRWSAGPKTLRPSCGDRPLR